MLVRCLSVFKVMVEFIVFMIGFSMLVWEYDGIELGVGVVGKMFL